MSEETSNRPTERVETTPEERCAMVGDHPDMGDGVCWCGQVVYSSGERQ